MSEQVNYQVIRSFGPSVFKVKIPDSILNHLNSYVEEIIQNKKKQAELNWAHKLAGDVTEEFILEKEIIEKSGWLKFLSTCVYKWIELETGKKITKFKLISTWIVRQFENEYNPLHSHSGHISGVGYLKVPDNFGETIQKNKYENFNGHLQLVHGTKMFLSPVMLNIEPKVGDFYFFPNYLMHTVYHLKISLLKEDLFHLMH